jgi:hypothetical protein
MPPALVDSFGDLLDVLEDDRRGRGGGWPGQRRIGQDEVARRRIEEVLRD